MKVQLLYPRRLGGKLYHKGQHEIPDALKSDWFVKEMLKVGDMSILTVAEEPKEQDLEEQDVEPGEDLGSEESDDFDFDDEEEKSVGKKKRDKKKR